MPIRSDRSSDINFSCWFRMQIWALSGKEPGFKPKNLRQWTRFKKQYWPCRLYLWSQQHSNQLEKWTAEMLSDFLGMKTCIWKALVLYVSLLAARCVKFCYFDQTIQTPLNGSHDNPKILHSVQNIIAWYKKMWYTGLHYGHYSGTYQAEITMLLVKNFSKHHMLRSLMPELWNSLSKWIMDDLTKKTFFSRPLFHRGVTIIGCCKKVVTVSRDFSHIPGIFCCELSYFGNENFQLLLLDKFLEF